MIRSSKQCGTMRNKIRRLIDTAFQGLKIFISVLTVIGVGMLFYWLGLKGIVGFMTGIVLMSVLLATQNPMLMMLLRATRSEWYAKELIKQGDVKHDKEKEG